ncbi:ClC family H(+)/Cl(-) exchange transporter [Mycobacterium sp. smrl_JER01]|uniref:ClC family H(+)/Cl(-) exchange transporter n=1 Tax=Mycobacterium sp. smrl_JER01 TaxID=3402633 RepID=UPI003AC4A153
MSRTGDPPAGLHRIAALSAAAIAGGLIIGLAGGAFRWCLQTAETLRVDLIEWAQRLPGPGWLIPIAVVAACAAGAALMVRWEPLAIGSGIPHVEAVFLGQATLPRLRVLPARFVGGVLAIGSGLVLGREGPTVHMGAAVGAEAARRIRLSDPEARTMQAAMGGAGLAVAFNAPLAGVLFTLEEVTKSWRAQAVLVSVLAAATAIGSSRLLLGDQPDFQVGPVAAPEVGWLPLFLVFGACTGVLGAAYNAAVLWALDHVGRIRRMPTVATAGAIGAGVGLLLWVAPLTVGDGDTVTQMLLDGHELFLLAAAGLLAARFVTGPLCYSAAVPGGLFAPLLAVGALWGTLFLGGFAAIWPNDTAFLALPMVLAGMTAFFGASVRAPLTGIVIVIEMTATTTAAVPMLIATAAAVVTANAVGSRPIYDSLRDRMSAAPGPAQP